MEAKVTTNTTYKQKKRAQFKAKVRFQFYWETCEYFSKINPTLLSGTICVVVEKL